MEEFRVDAHVKVLDERVVTRAKRAGLDALVYAPHFTCLRDIEATAARYADDDFVVIPGREVFTGAWRNRKHVLAVDLIEPIPDFITLEAAMAELDRQDAAVLVPHPAFATVSLDRTDVTRYRDNVHAIETLNAKLPSWINRRGRVFAHSVDRPEFASSYAHLRGTVGEAWTTFPDTEPTADAIIEAIKEGVPRDVERRGGIGHGVRRTMEFSHLLYENSVSKFDRTVLSGMEATHPNQSTYAGRFDGTKTY